MSLQQLATQVPPPTDEQLASCPGALAAWKGLAAMELRVCVVRGSKVKIAPERLAAFQGAPLDVQDAVEKLKAPPRGRFPLAHMGQA